MQKDRTETFSLQLQFVKYWWILLKKKNVIPINKVIVMIRGRVESFKN